MVTDVSEGRSGAANTGIVAAFMAHLNTATAVRNVHATNVTEIL